MSSQARLRTLAVAATFGLSVAIAAQGDAAVYTNGAAINYASERGAVLTSGGPVGHSSTDLQNALHPFYGTDIRWNNNYGAGPTWTLELPDVTTLDRFNIGHHGVINTVKFDFQTSLDGTTFTTQSTFNGALSGTNDGQTDKYAAGTFAPVQAKFVRVNVYGHNGGETPTIGDESGHNQYIFNRVQVYGPETNVAINPRISVAQSTWNNGSAVMIDPWYSRGANANDPLTPQSRPNLVDDYQLLTDYFTNGVGQQDANEIASGSNVAPQYEVQVAPTQFIVTLNDAYGIGAVAMSSINDSRRARDMDIYLSPDASGINWTLVRSLRDLPQIGYQEWNVAWVPFDARRVMFEISRIYGPSQNSNLQLDSGYVSEFYVFVPEPASAALFCLAGIPLLKRRRNA